MAQFDVHRNLGAPVDRLGPWVVNLGADGDRIVDALDLVISRAWG